MSFGERRPSAFGSSSASRSGLGKGKGNGKSKPREYKPRVFTPRVVVDPDAEPVVLTEEQIAKSRQRGMNIALWHLGQSAKTRKELADRLLRKDIRVDIVESVLVRLEELGLVNDTEYAAGFVRSRHENRKQGAGAIRFALRNKGVDPELVATALESIDPDAEFANAVALVARKLPSTRGLDRNKRTNRLVGMLARKGYNPGVAYQVIREALDGEVPDENSGGDSSTG
ncbi:regulatory protein RecX [Tessaracoccus sp.]